jgi:hypothetical protein
VDDPLAMEILSELGAGDLVDQRYLDAIDDRTQLALGRYGVRSVTLALRDHDPQLLHDALLARAIAAGPGDPRDSMVGLALHIYCAEELGLAPIDVFGRVADQLVGTEVAQLLRDFGTRNDITLDAFGWELVETSSGTDFIPI